MKTRLSIAALLVSCALGAQAAPVITSASGADAPTARVRVDDLNLASTRGVEQLNRRIERAARQVCVRPFAEQPRQRALVAQCVDLAVSEAREDAARAIADATRVARAR